MLFPFNISKKTSSTTKIEIEANSDKEAFKKVAAVISTADFPEPDVEYKILSDVDLDAAIPFVNRILTNKLRSEEESLAMFTKLINDKDEKTAKFANGNISSNQNRVDEIKDVIEFLTKNYQKKRKEPNNQNQ